MIDRTSPVPVYQQLKALIKKKIISGFFSPNKSIPSERKLCEIFGVSRITLREALNNLKKEGLLYSSIGKGTYVKALPVSKSKSSKRIGLICSSVDNEITPVGNMINGIDHELKKHNCSFLLRISNDNSDEERKILNEFSTQVDGIIVVPAMHNRNKDYFEEISKSIPIVFAERKLPGLNIPYVGYDNISASRKVVSEFIAKGHKKIAFISEDDDISPARERYEGYRQAFKDAGKRLDYSLVKWFKTRHEEGLSYTLIKDFLEEKKPHAILFAYRNTFVINVIEAAHELNMSIPENLEFAGFCSFPTIISGSTPFTEIDCNQVALKIGENAAKWVLKQLDGDELICKNEALEIKSIRKRKINIYSKSVKEKAKEKEEIRN